MNENVCLHILLRLCAFGGITQSCFDYLFVEYNYVKLLGTIISGVRTLANGTKSFIVRTNEENNV